jgi:hypothetical protein
MSEAQNTAAKRLCVPEVADLHHFDEEQDPDNDSHQNKRSDPDLHQSESRIRIRMKVKMRIRNKFNTRKVNRDPNNHFKSGHVTDNSCPGSILIEKSTNTDAKKISPIAKKTANQLTGMYLLPNGAQVHGLGDDFVIVRRVRLGDGPVKWPAVTVSQQACIIISTSSFWKNLRN